MMTLFGGLVVWWSGSSDEGRVNVVGLVCVSVSVNSGQISVETFWVCDLG